MTDIARLEKICESSLRAVGFELVELEYLRDRYGWVLRLYIDHLFEDKAGGQGSVVDSESGLKSPRSSISHQDCELASHQLGTVLDVEDLISGQYRLEVSSPGVQRPLRKERDFKRFIGQTVRIQMQEAVDGRRNFLGRLLSMADDRVGVEVDGKVFQLPLQSIRRARLEVEF
jgi:ribosome maturation factor RimP